MDEKIGWTKQNTNNGHFQFHRDDHIQVALKRIELNWIKWLKLILVWVCIAQNEARKLNHQEVVEEDHRKKLPSNWDAKQRQVEWEEEQEKLKKVSIETCWDKVTWLQWSLV